MLITFKRYGHANNSSSSHSIIFAPHLNERDDFNAFEFGWDTFTLRFRRAKEAYLLIQWIMTNGEKRFSYDTVRNEATEDALDELYQELKNYNQKTKTFNHLDDIYINDLRNNSDYYIDHQSVITWPIDKVTGKVSLDFFFDLSHEILNNDYLILGGNDNDGEHPLSESGSNMKQSFIELYHSIIDQGRGTITAFKDPLTKEWTISNSAQYSSYAGTLMKVVFGNDLPEHINLNDPKIFFSDEKTNFFQKKSFPYLVDLKINSYCNYGCEFCYTSSTSNDDHANADYIINHVLEVLRDAKVFEIVLGGGEPTTHPRLHDIVKQAKKFGFKIGITSKNYNFHKHPNAVEIMSNVDSLAFSINTTDELEKAVNCVNILRTFKTTPQFYMQTILGLQDWKETLKLCELAQHTFKYITFLGYKSYGFGKNVKSVIVDKDWYIDISQFSKKYNVNIGIDSILANKYREELTARLVDWNYLVGAEGKASCYVDCVKSTVAASSFTDNGIEEFNFMDHGIEAGNKFLEIFKKF